LHHWLVLLAASCWEWVTTRADTLYASPRRHVTNSIIEHKFLFVKDESEHMVRAKVFSRAFRRGVKLCLSLPSRECQRCILINQRGVDMPLFVAHHRTSPKALHERYGSAALLLDVTSATVEGIWQGVRYLSPLGLGLCLDSTATRHSVAAVPLWLQRPTLQGVLTRRPFSPSLAEREAF
jgi:hypothetical protein